MAININKGKLNFDREATVERQFETRSSLLFIPISWLDVSGSMGCEHHRFASGDDSTTGQLVAHGCHLTARVP